MFIVWQIKLQITKTKLRSRGPEIIISLVPNDVIWCLKVRIIA